MTVIVDGQEIVTNLTAHARIKRPQFDRFGARMVQHSGQHGMKDTNTKATTSPASVTMMLVTEPCKVETLSIATRCPHHFSSQNVNIMGYLAPFISAGIAARIGAMKGGWQPAVDNYTAT